MNNLKKTCIEEVLGRGALYAGCCEHGACARVSLGPELQEHRWSKTNPNAALRACENKTSKRGRRCPLVDTIAKMGAT